MTRNSILFGLIGGGIVGLLAPHVFGFGFGIGNFVVALFGAVLGLVAVGAYVHFSERVR